MKILFTARPAYGHLYPLMPLAIAAREAGHDVGFATGERFVPKLESLGFPAHVAGISIEEGRAIVLGGGDTVPAREDGRPDPDFGGRLFFDALAPRTVGDLAPLLERLKPDVVIYEQGDFGAPVAAGAAGLPAVCHALSRRMPPQAIEAVSGGRVKTLWAQRGIEVPPLDVFIGDAYVDIVPERLQDPAFVREPARIPARPIAWSEPDAALPAWVGSRSRPLVYLTLGTVVGSPDNLRPAVAALAALDADVLVALGSAAETGLRDLPDNVHVEPFVDQAGLLPHVDLVAHHGGSGTTFGALAQGKRQLVLPKGADQFFNADALRAAGLAPVLEPDAATPSAIATAAAAALEAPVPSAVLDVRDEIAAMPGPDEALRALLERVA